MPVWLLRDMKLGKYDVKAHEELIVNYQAI